MSTFVTLVTRPLTILSVSPLPRWLVLVLLALSVVLQACSTTELGKSRLLGEDASFAVILAGEDESYAGLAEAFYRDPGQAWRISEANENRPLRAGTVVTVPKRDENPGGIRSDGYQTVPILSYHRFGEGRGRLSVSAEQFDAQMAYLRDQGFHVVALADAAAFFRGERALPRKSVVLTIDDGYRSVYNIAYPILSRYGYPATVFIYSDYINRGGLSWDQMREMEASGLISFQAHSKTHANLTQRLPDETLADYRRRLKAEVSMPVEKLSGRMGDPVYGYAYPFGAVNRLVVDELKRAGYELGATVRRGGNPFFAFPYGLRRTMIYESDELADFADSLVTYERYPP